MGGYIQYNLHRHSTEKATCTGYFKAHGSSLQMTKLHKIDRDSRFRVTSLLPLGLLVIGLGLIALQLFYNAGSYLMSWVTPVKHPNSYDFAQYDKTLQQCVHGSLVDYQWLKKTKALDSAVNELANVSPDKLSAVEDKLAYWINAYNMLTLKSIVDHYPVDSVKELARTMSLQKMIVGGHAYSIQEIKSHELDPLFQSLDPRALFLLCQGAKGYPPLLNHAVQVKLLPNDLNASTYDFINDPQNVNFDPDDSTLYLSHYLKWNEDAISKTFGSVANLLTTYLANEKKFWFDDKRLQIRYKEDFDWALNDTAASSTGQP